MSTNKLAGKIARPVKADDLAGMSSERSRRELVEQRAYELWVATGCGHGNDIDHWLQAEREVLEGQAASSRPTERE